MRWLVLLLAACGGSHVEPTKQAAPSGKCTTRASQPIRVAGNPGTVDFVVCEIKRTKFAPAAVEVLWHAHLLLVPDHGSPIVTTIYEWLDRDDWTAKIELDGVLVSPSGDGVPIVTATEQAHGDSLGALAFQAAARIYNVIENEWQLVEMIDATLVDVAVSPDRRLATVRTCQWGLSELSLQPLQQNCGGLRDAFFHRELQLRWTGTRVDVAEIPQRTR